MRRIKVPPPHAATSSIVKWAWAFNGLVSTAGLLLPLMASPESHVQTGAASVASSASAHVNFKIVIPQVLFLQVGSRNNRAEDAQTVSILSNSRSVTLGATDRTPDSGPHALGSLILGASARKIIAQDARCTLRFAHGAAGPTEPSDRVSVNSHQLVCTASMP